MDLGMRERERRSRDHFQVLGLDNWPGGQRRKERYGLGRRRMCVTLYTFSERVLPDTAAAFVTKWSVQA